MATGGPNLDSEYPDYSFVAHLRRQQEDEHSRPHEAQQPEEADFLFQPTPINRNPINAIDPLLINHQLIHYNLGPIPAPCGVCQSLGNRQPENIFLRHCIPRCPAIILPFGLVFVTSDYFAPNDIRPSVVYQHGANYFSAIPGGYQMVQPIFIGVFNPVVLNDPAAAANTAPDGEFTRSPHLPNHYRRGNMSGNRTPFVNRSSRGYSAHRQRGFHLRPNVD